MKATTTSSIGAALFACAAKAPDGRHSYRAGPGAVARDVVAQKRRTDPSMHLTPRQLEVLALLCEGLPNKLICRRLNISTGTVKVHVSCVLKELGVATRLQAVVAARRRCVVAEHPVSAPAPAAIFPCADQLRADAARRSTANYREAVAF